ncbi:hypothetical protein A5906_38350 [Bradyrhizobium sacchari]|uniref:hypothetical protein n=1 Tax=Bradyrhizobium sacchari TaxID=1399419 RepID=UPI0009B13CD9|nr:hypothetical protein [Bradyrhizobium sacchari]OPY97295.1 hypothetical protein A5906_38350 [Bradyrhizobium sacchari]
MVVLLARYRNTQAAGSLPVFTCTNIMLLARGGVSHSVVLARFCATRFSRQFDRTVEVRR